MRPWRVAHGAVGGTILYTEDLTDRKRTEEELRNSEDRWRTLLSLLPVGVYACDAEGLITYFNPRAVEIWGRAPAPGDRDERFCGALRLFHVDGRPLPHDQAPVVEALRRGTSFRNEEVVVERPDGSRVVVAVNIDPIVRDGAVVGMINCFADITDRKQAETELRRSDDRFRRAADAARLLMYDVALEPGGKAEVFGLAHVVGEEERGTDLSSDWWHARIHPDDLPGHLKRLQSCLDDAGCDSYLANYRVRHADGSWRFVEDQASIERRDGTTRRLVGTIRDITRQHDLEEQLRDADRKKDEFLATLAHELRNPLAPIRNGLQVMKLAAGEPGAVEESRAMMERQVEQMARLIDDLMDVSRISRGKIVLQRARMNLAEAVRNAIDASRPLIEAQEHAFVVDLPAEPIYVDGDLTRLSQVFANLLDNAAKYTPPRGRLRLTVERRDAEVLVVVEDDGVGIPSPMLDRVFDLFAQLDRSLERSQGGLGIGLNIVKRLVGKHGGTITVESGGARQGSRFTVRLPLLPSEAGAAPTAVDISPAPPARRRILVVDDNHDGARSLALMLNLTGNETRTAHDGLEAVAAAEAFRPDVILMDIGMPRLNGYDACARIREQPWGKEAMIVACTGWGHEDDRRRAAEAGFDRHLTKPVDPMELERLLLAPRS